MKNLMIDLETMGVTSKAPIVSIGAVFFEPGTGELGKSFYTSVDLASDMALGAIPDGGTINWWLMQSSEARSAISSDQAEGISSALNGLATFVSCHCEQPSYLNVWGNGATFDNVILRAAYERCGTPLFWHWSNDLDVRTLVYLGRQVGFDPKRDFPFSGDRHNALDDDIHQAKYVSAIHQRLMAPHQQDIGFVSR